MSIYSLTSLLFYSQEYLLLESFTHGSKYSFTPVSSYSQDHVLIGVFTFLLQGVNAPITLARKK
jgi:hypothetical protein